MNEKRFLILAVCACTVACQATLRTPSPPTCAPSPSPPAVGTPSPASLNTTDQYWMRAYSGNYAQQAQAVMPVSDNGYVFVGWSQFQSTAERDQDAWVVRLDAQGTPLWSKLYGGQQDDSAGAVLAAADGCLVLGGFNSSQPASAWIAKINTNGALLWTKAFGAGFKYDVKALVSTQDGGYLILGSTDHQSFPASDAWIAKLDSAGNLLWTRILGGEDGDSLTGIVPTPDGYLAVGYSASLGAGKADAWLVKFNASGDILWSKSFGGAQDDTASAIIPSGDGDFVITGSTNTFNALLFKVDGQGKTLWARVLKGNELDSLYALTRGTTGEYVAVGSSHAGDKPAAPWVVAVSDGGELLWSKSYDGIHDSAGTSIQSTSDGGYIIAGGAGISAHSAWVMKTDGRGELNERCGVAKTLEIKVTQVSLLGSSESVRTAQSVPVPTDAAHSVIVRDLKARVGEECVP